MTAKENSFHNFENIAKLEGTLIFLMGIKNLGLIASELIKYGKNPDTPAAVIEKGTTGNQKTVTGVLGTIKQTAEEKGITPPAVVAVSYTHLTLPTNISRCRSRWSPYH